MQFSLVALLVTSFYRANVLSIVYIFFYCGIYIVKGRIALGRLWPSLVALTLISILWQYLIVLVRLTVQAQV